ncbi:MAG: double zinc ribbon domain-containing protein [Rhodospirillales bacterium]|nr:double zinc ribbon domain-containing protein [Rhodospirillales bacterium]
MPERRTLLRHDTYNLILDMLYPPRCLNCELPVGGNGSLCGLRWSNITFIGGAQ